MEKIDIYTEFKKISFGIEDHKVIVSSDYNNIFYLVQAFKKVFSKTLNSEYETVKSIIKVNINDKEVDLKRNIFLMVNEFFDFDQDIKLSSKSLTLKYLESKLQNIEYNDIISTLNILLTDLSGEITKELCSITKEWMHFKMMEFNQKLIIKNLEPSIIKEEYLANTYDMDYEEVINLQLSMISEIAGVNSLLTYWLLFQVPVLTKELFDKLQKFPKNVKSIIITPESDTNFDANKILIIEKECIDISNEIDVYEKLIMNYEKHISLEEMKILIMEYVYSKDKRQHKLIKYL